MTKLEIKQKIQDIYFHMELIDVKKATVTLKVENDNILKLLAEEYGCHLYEPFELSSMHDHKMIIYRKEESEISIAIESKEQYRRETILKPY